MFSWSMTSDFDLSSVRRLLVLAFLVCVSLPVMFSLVPPTASRYELVAECGVGAPIGRERCPLAQCCSTQGFCGTSPEHCGVGCQSNCHQTHNSGNPSYPSKPDSPSGSTPPPNGHDPGPVTPTKPPPKSPKPPGTGPFDITGCPFPTVRSIAYYESWSSRRPCDIYEPWNIDPSSWTHINFAFAILNSDGQVIPSAKNDTDMYADLMKLKHKQPQLQVWIAIGGFTVAGKPFSTLSQTNTSRVVFIDSVVSFLDTHGFDGVDIDWEYPAAAEKGGSPEDTQNFVFLVSELKKRLQEKKKGLSVTVPAGQFYMHGFDLKGMEPFVDWFNVMSYDLHGSWDQPLVINPHTNLTEIKQSIQIIHNAGIPFAKLNLGLAYYGDTFTLSDSTCITPGCTATGAGKAGPCSTAAGTLIDAEIQAVIHKNGIKPVFDESAAVKYFAWDADQWVSYDDEQTFKIKKEYARQKCFGGTFVWAEDMVVPR